MVKKLFVILFVLLIFVPTGAEAGRSPADAKRAAQFERYYGLLPDSELQKRISAIGERLVVANGLSKDDFTFKVLNSPEVNAVTIPGGYIYIFKGLSDFMQTDEELAAVIGHEMGHVTGNHIARREREQLLTMLLGALIGGPQAAIAANAALAALPGYNQRDEREADDSGFRFLVNANMNPYAMVVVMNKLADTDNSQIKRNFSQHPEPDVRARRIMKYIGNMKIKPEVDIFASKAVVRDDGWSFDITRSAGMNKPYYRALLLAGSFYLIARDDTLSPDKFIVVEERDKAEIYYDDIHVYTVTRIDASSESKSIAQKAYEYVEDFRQWVTLRVAARQKAINP